MRRGARLSAVAATLFFSSHAAASERPRVVIVRDANDDDALARSYVRLRSELTSAGFDVEERVGPSGSRDDDRPLAVVEVRRATSGGTADIVVVDHATNKTVIRTVDPPLDDPSILAMRVVELMRASLVEPIALPSPEGLPSPAAPPLPAPVAAWTALRAPRWTFALGAAAVHAGGAIGLAGAPSFAASFAPTPGTRVRAVVLAPAFGGEIASAEWRATVRQGIGLVELGWEPPVRAWLRPRLGAGIGLYGLDAQGHASPPYVGRRGAAVSALASLGCGGAAALGRSARVALEGRALVALPRPVVRFASVEAGAAMRPGAAVTLALEVDL